MKILYLTSSISGSGGVQRILASKSNYFIVNGNHQVEIVYNELFTKTPFYDFNDAVRFQNLALDNKALSYIFKFKKAICKIITQSHPDVVIVSDNGLKGFLVPLLFKSKIPIILEVHSSKREIIKNNFSFFSILKRKLHLRIKSFSITKFDEVVFLNQSSAQEWGVENAKIIPNALPFETKQANQLSSKIAIAIGRHSYEKGIDRLLPIWKGVISENPEWKLEIYGAFTEQTIFLKKQIEKLQIQNSVELLEPVLDIERVYSKASIFLMSSRFEGFGMALLEAMSFGLPVMAYDCPVGPRDLIENDYDGILIPNENIEQYIEQLNFLIQNKEQQRKLGKNAVSKAFTFKKDYIMLLWEGLLKKAVEQSFKLHK